MAFDGDGDPSVSIGFNKAGAKKLGIETEKLARACNEDGKVRRLAIVVDGVLYSSPTVRVAVTGGSASIVGGGFSEEEARLLALAISSGSLPSPLRIVSVEKVARQETQ